MLKVAITGGIGSGKTYVSNILKEKGFQIYDCDSAAKRIISQNESIKQQLKKLVGDNLFVENKLSKAMLSAYILQSKENALKVNKIVHPKVAEDFLLSGLNFMECALLFSSGFNALVDKVICVSAPMEIRIKRITTRDKINEQMAKEWILSQMAQEEIKKLSDFEIINDGNHNLIYEIDKILSFLNLKK